MMTGPQFPPLTPLALDFQSTVFVLLVAVILPVGAVRTKSIIAFGRPGRRPPRKSDVLTRALLVQTLLFALSFVSLFIIGGLSGIFMAATPVDHCGHGAGDPPRRGRPVVASAHA